MKKDISLSFLSGLMLSLPFSFGRLWVIAWFGFLPLFFGLRNKSKPQAFLLAYLTGVVFWWGTIYWLVHVTLLGTILLVFYLALYFGLFGLMFKTHDPRPTTHDLFFAPSLWVLLEYARSHLLTGFPWALLGYSQYLNLPIIQIADITGAWGVSFAVMLVNVAIYNLVTRSPGHQVTSKNLVLPILCLFLNLGYGFYSLYLRPSTFDLRPFKVSLIQGNIPQALKWDIRARNFIIERYSGLTLRAAQEKPDLIIWPEAASPGLFPEDEEIFKQISSLTKGRQIPLLIGAVAQEGEKYFNSALLVGAGGRVIGRYDKLHLVPFGEYIPLKKALPFLQAVVPIGDIAAGNDYTVFSLDPRPTTQDPRRKTHDPVKFSVLICFEDLFPELSRQFVRKGADFLVNITNDGWYKRTSAPYQHLQASVFRAVENRRYLARAANTGVSGFIGPQGKIIALVRDARLSELFIDGYAAHW